MHDLFVSPLRQGHRQWGGIRSVAVVLHLPGHLQKEQLTREKEQCQNILWMDKILHLFVGGFSLDSNQVSSYFRIVSVYFRNRRTSLQWLSIFVSRSGETTRPPLFALAENLPGKGCRNLPGRTVCPLEGLNKCPCGG